MSKEDDFEVPVGKAINLADCDPAWVPKWARKQQGDETNSKKDIKKEALSLLEDSRQNLVELQELFWASNTYSMLIVLQGMDAAGKDSTISHVMSGVNPQGCQVTAFKTPSAEELSHDFLWRYNKALPEKGHIGIFNRSYYEDVLIVKVRPEVLAKANLPADAQGKQFWSQRYEDINLFERHLVRNGTVVLKFFLHVSKKEQKQRLLDRLKKPDKEWKFSITDVSEREKWSDYMDAYQDMLNNTSSEWAPWHVIPSDKKWVAHWLISETIVSHMKKLDLKYPVLSKADCDALAKAKAELEKD
jgi:PPK2 family polyphosphate:nucleotide phosphotransferase